MAHLGDDVTAFVDGQLPPASMDAASAHLETCESCRHAVRQQQLLKSRMREVGGPELPASLLASLSTLPQDPPARRPWWLRVLASTPIGVGAVLLGASMAVVAVAYVVGPDDDSVADTVTPTFDRYAAQFTSDGPQPSGSFTIGTMHELDEYGWPCHARLGTTFERVAGRYEDQGETVALIYSDGVDDLHLFEQGGVLDQRAVRGFEHRRLADHPVWVREGRPRVVTWDTDGVVFTVVTDLDDARLGPALADLPGAASRPDPVERVGHGLDRMTTWIAAA